MIYKLDMTSYHDIIRVGHSAGTRVANTTTGGAHINSLDQNHIFEARIMLVLKSV